ncbi:hypothetical protein D0864_07890 [Hortaea werneckii]|uniref:Uncharacterized protein n=1 Tax=Hortaea werneckii TaxID=91943 RepID=A0A3M7F3S5_HORWE|nr:hypothetical protein KC338_g5414 [Hortaea werneckii]RMY83181.1 hypothetical protein D0864_07890 [Hortaea werneckii]RMY84722.1 hypothetical protein D0862_11347 [Hortaea werneckii]
MPKTSPDTASSPSGPPYLPTSVALIGGRPTVDVDVPILAILLLLYLGGAIGNASIFLRNRKRGHFFPMSMAMFGFCMSRIATCSVRIAWAAHPTNVNLAIAATIFAAVGILIVFVIVLLLAQRILRATHPKLGWSRTLSGSLKATYFGLFIAIVLVIAFTILNYFTLDSNLRNIAIWIQRAGILYMLGFNLIGPVLVLLSLILPCPTEFTTPDNFGVKSSMLSKYVVLGVTMFFTLFIIGFRMGTAWAEARPASDPAWWERKAAYYVIEYGFEVVIVYWLLLARFDQMFWIPNKSHGPGDYSRKTALETSKAEASKHEPQQA